MIDWPEVKLDDKASIICNFWTFDLSLLANEIVEKPAVLFQMLKSNENWTSVAKKGEVTLVQNL